MLFISWLVLKDMVNSKKCSLRMFRALSFDKIQFWLRSPHHRWNTFHRNFVEFYVRFQLCSRKVWNDNNESFEIKNSQLQTYLSSRSLLFRDNGTPEHSEENIF